MRALVALNGAAAHPADHAWKKDRSAATAAPISGAEPPSSPSINGVGRIKGRAEATNPLRSASHHCGPALTTEPETMTTSGSTVLAMPPSTKPRA